MNTKTQVGILGAGAVVELVHLPVLRSLPDVEVAWICDMDEKRARSMADLFGIPQVYKSLSDCPKTDVVLVAIPVGARRAALDEILAKGCHAFCEKPFAPNLEDHQWIVARAREKNLRLGAAFMRRFYWGTTTARTLIASNVFGPVESVIAGEGSRLQRTGRSGDWYQSSAAAAGGGVMRETGSHLVDQAFSIVQPRSFVIDHCVQQLWEGLEFETHAGATITGADGNQARFSVCVSKLRDTFKGIAIRTATCELRIGLEAESALEIWNRSGERVSRFTSPRSGARAHLTAIRHEWLDFLQSLAQGTDFSDYDTGLLTTAFLDDCYQQAEPQVSSEAIQ